MKLYEVVCGNANRFFDNRRDAEAFMQQYIDAGRKIRLDIYEGPTTASAMVEFLNKRTVMLAGVTCYTKTPSKKTLTVSYGSR